MSEQDEAQQILAAMCEDGILQKPRVTDDGNVIRYSMTAEYQQRLYTIIDHPERWDEPELQPCKDLLVKLAANLRRKQ